jgi:hypothetical protein
MMAVRFHLVVDCRDPEPLAAFWATAVAYEFGQADLTRL